jgi:hypothetical protein
VQVGCPFNVSLALSGAESVIAAGATCVVKAAFFNSAGAPFTPASIAYQIDDINSGANIVASTPVTPANTVSITVTAAQNALLSAMRASEEHQLALTVIDGASNIGEAAIRWCIQRILPS